MILLPIFELFEGVSRPVAWDQGCGAAHAEGQRILNLYHSLPTPIGKWRRPDLIGPRINFRANNGCQVILTCWLGFCMEQWRSQTKQILTQFLPPPPLYKLRPCPSYSRRRDRNNCVRNFNYVRNVVWPHRIWVCRHICQLHGAMDTCNMPHARQAHSQEFEVVRAQTSP